ncbi:MAG: ParB N-terminal domain-containing protein [Gemmataceae bacterium]
MKTISIGRMKFFLKHDTLLPKLPEAEFVELLADIEQRGIEVPIIVTPEGIVIDGHHRLRAAKKLGLRKIPKVVLTGLSSKEQKARAIAVNFHRRQLTMQQKKELIAELLRANPERADRDVADAVNGSPKTVKKLRARLVDGGEIPHLTLRTDRRGRKQPARKPSRTAALAEDNSAESESSWASDLTNAGRELSELAAWSVAQVDLAAKEEKVTRLPEVVSRLRRWADNFEFTFVSQQQGDDPVVGVESPEENVESPQYECVDEFNTLDEFDQNEM